MTTPTKPDAHRAALDAEQMNAAERPDLALQVLSPFLHPGADSIEVLDQAARATFKQGRHRDLLVLAQRMVELGPEAGAGPFWAAIAQTALGQWQYGKQAGELAVSLEPEVARYHAALGDALLAGPRANYTAAVASYAKAVELEPGNPAWHLSYASALITRADGGWPMTVEDAADHLRIVLDRQPGNPAAVREMARLEVVSGHKAAGMQGFAYALKVNPFDRASEMEIVRVLRTTMGFGLVATIIIGRFVMINSGYSPMVPYLLIGGILTLTFIAFRTAPLFLRVDPETRLIIWQVMRRNISELSVAIVTTVAVIGLVAYLLFLYLT